MLPLPTHRVKVNKLQLSSFVGDGVDTEGEIHVQKLKLFVYS